MKTRFILFKRAGVFYSEDTTTGKQHSLRTKDEAEALTILHSKNEAHRQPILNLQIARTYLTATDPEVARRTWQTAMDELTKTKTENTYHRHVTAMKDKAFDVIRNVPILETQSAHFLKALELGSVSTNVYLRRIHNFALDMNWLPWSILPKRQWPKVKFKEKRAIKLEEHQRIIAAEVNPERKTLYQLCWHLGASQGDIASLKGEDVDWTSNTIGFTRKKSGVPVLVHLGAEALNLLKDLPAEGPLFTYLSTVRAGDRATEFCSRCRQLGIKGVTHVLGIRAFGTQLLCEQVIGRALRRQSYDLNEENLFNVEYADVFGIPFDFNAKPVIAPPQPPRETIQVKAVRPERDNLEIRFPRVEGYRIELPEERLTAVFNEDSIMELTPDLVGPSITQNSGIIGKTATMSLEHLGDMRPSTLLFHVTQRLLYTKWRDPGEEPKLHLFGQLKRITKQWLDTCLVCKGGTYPAQLMYQELADMACNRITQGITRAFIGERPIKALLDAYNPVGSTKHVRFNTSKLNRWETGGPPPKCQINWVVLDSDWEGEFCRVAEYHPKVVAYVKNQNLGLEVPYRYGSENRNYLPDFIVLVDDGHGPSDLLHLIVEIKGYRREDAKEKKSTMETYWVPGVNQLKTYGRWAFAEFTEVYQIETDFAAKVEKEFNKMIESATMPPKAQEN